MDRAAYKLLKRRLHVARQRALLSLDPQAWREYEKVKNERDRAWRERLYDIMERELAA